MEKDDKGSTLTRIGVSGWGFLLVPAYPGCPGSKAVKRSLLLLLLLLQNKQITTYKFSTRLLRVNMYKRRVTNSSRVFLLIRMLCQQRHADSKILLRQNRAILDRRCRKRAECNVCAYVWIVIHTTSYLDQHISRHGTGSHLWPSDSGIQWPGDPVDPVTLFCNELQMSTYVADKRLQRARGLPVFIAVWRVHASGN